MPRVQVIHWKPAEAGPLLEACRNAGCETEFDVDADATAIGRAIKANLPDAIVIDLSRLPSHGRNVGIWLRGAKKTRAVPLVFVGGEEAKVAEVRTLMPDAVYTTIRQLPKALPRAMRNRLADPVVPPQMMDRYAQKTAAQKLGIEPGSQAAVFDAPRDYAAVLGELPEGAELVEDPSGKTPVTVWFVDDPADLASNIRKMAKRAAASKLWIAWRKGPKKPVGENLVRETALEAGLVDYKICSLDSRWSALLFSPARKAADR